MFDHLIRIFLLIAIITFGLRGLLPELGLPGWSLMLGFASGAMLAYGVNSLGRISHYPRYLGRILHGRLTNPIARTDLGASGNQALST